MAAEHCRLAAVDVDLENGYSIMAGILDHRREIASLDGLRCALAMRTLRAHSPFAAAVFCQHQIDGLGPDGRADALDTVAKRLQVLHESVEALRFAVS